MGRQGPDERRVILVASPTHPWNHATTNRGCQHPVDLGGRPSGADPDNQVGMGPIPVNVRLTEQSSRILIRAVVGLPPFAVGCLDVGSVHLV